jgi:hypothetical protein
MAEKKGPIVFKIPSPTHTQDEASRLNAEFVDTLHAHLTKDGDTVEVTGKQEGPPFNDV